MQRGSLYGVRRRYVVFSTNGSFTVPPDVRRLRVIAIAGGAGGGGGGGAGAGGGDTTIKGLSVLPDVEAFDILLKGGGTVSNGVGGIGFLCYKGEDSPGGGGSRGGHSPFGEAGQPRSWGSGGAAAPAGGTGGGAGASFDHVCSVRPGQTVSWTLGAGGAGGAGSPNGTAGIKGAIAFEWQQ